MVHGVSEFLFANIGLVYFVYGLAFFAMGLVTSLQARALAGLRPISRLWLLSVFGLLHGISEWLELATRQGWPAWASVPFFDLALKVLSYVFLLQFGAELLSSVRPVPGALRLLGPGLLGVWLALMIAIPAAGGVGSSAWLATAHATMRYTLGFPGSALTAYALWAVAAGWKGLESSGPARRYFKGAAVGFIVYSIVAGLTVPAAPFFPASVWNREAFESAFGVPVAVPRTLCALAIGGFLAEAFLVEISRAQAMMVDILRQMEQSREEFISVVAHDLRTPITVIAGYATILRELTPERHNTPFEQRALEGIQTSTRRLDRLVSDLLDASRIEAHRLVLKKELIDLPELIADVVERNAAVTAGHPVQVMVKDGVPKVVADPVRLDQILTNLLSNAAKYSFPDTPIAITVEPAPGEAVVSVTNQGPGIPPEERERLFTRFHRTEEAKASKAPGLGLGLYITKGLVEAHGGCISVDSRPGAETTFRFSLPLSNQ